jgi:hypothetical protein
VRSLLELRNGDWISGSENGKLQRWRNGRKTGEPIPTGQGAVLSLLELSNGDWISGGENSSLQRWSNGKKDGRPIATTGGVIRLLEQPNGDLISISFKGSLRRWLNSKEVLEQACKELSRHPALDAKNQGSKVEKAARTTCQRVNKPSSSQTED